MNSSCSHKVYTFLKNAKSVAVTNFQWGKLTATVWWAWHNKDKTCRAARLKQVYRLCVRVQEKKEKHLPRSVRQQGISSILPRNGTTQRESQPPCNGKERRTVISPASWKSKHVCCPYVRQQTIHSGVVLALCRLHRRKQGGTSPPSVCRGKRLSPSL